MAKLNGSERHARLLLSLAEQRHLLRKSIDDLTRGDLAEALRISAILRLLVHETGSSKPLLKQIKNNYLDLHVLDARPSRPNVVISIPIGLRISAEGVFLSPDLNDEPDARILATLGAWWRRPALILPIGGFSRREIVLGLANKEGGAHIDLDISKRYEALLNCGSFQVGYTQSECTAVNLSRLMVGQAGLEMLDCLNRNFPSS